jgi:hypothetical protein
MKSLLKNYTQRFGKNLNETKYETFFTQLEATEYIQKLPFLFEIDSFCLRLILAFLKGDKICIYSDYDTDAITATGTMYWGLIGLGFKEENLDFYAPDRFTEGYGMNNQATQELSTKFDLIISVDCGINSTQEAQIVKNQKGCDLIITDHHTITGLLPESLAIINPRVANFYKNEIEGGKVRKNEYQENQKLLIEELQNYKKQVRLEYLELFFEQIQERYNLSNEKNDILSESTTGVGVAWFSLVWFSYFMENILLN